MIEISSAVWEAIAVKGKFGETPDDVLRRELGIDPAAPGESYRPGPIQEDPTPPGGGQDVTTGRAAGKRGRSAAALAAEYLGAEKAEDGFGNEYMLNGERVLFKWAKHRNGRIGIYDGHVERIEFIIGVFENEDGDWELWKVPMSAINPVAIPSIAHDNQIQAQKKHVIALGELIGTIEQPAG